MNWERNLLIVTPEENFYGSLNGLSPDSRRAIFKIVYEKNVSKDGFQRIQRLIQDNNIKGIISRGYWADFLERRLDIPVFPFLVDAFDMLLNIDSIIQKGFQHIGVFGCMGNQKGSYYYGNIYDFKFGDSDCHLTHVKTMEEIEFVFERMRSLYQIEAVMGDVESKDFIESHGLPFFPYQLDSRFLAQTIENAENMIRVSEHQKRHHTYVETLTNIISECSLITNEAGEILFSNLPAQDKLKLNELECTNIHKLLPDFELAEGRSNRIVKINGKTYILNMLPVTLHGEQHYSILLSDTKQIESAEFSIRRQLHENRLTAKYHFEDIVHASSATSQIIHMARRYAASDGTILITGESGTGKEVYANSIHNESPRKTGPFVAINCATLTESLIESELFGYEKGAFTGALTSGKKGLFELAHNGTLFLDEIGELPIGLQAKLLRVLQEHEVRHIGGSKNIPVNVRIIAATNKDLLQMVHNGTFREDLFYRLSLLEMHLLPIRERREDIIPLFKHFLSIQIKESGRKLYWHGDEVFFPLLSYSWPGNIRELQNVAARAMLLCDSLELTAGFLESLLPLHSKVPNALSSKESTGFSISDTQDLNELESKYIAYLLQKFHNNKEEVCQYLGISKPTLWRKLTYLTDTNTK